MSTILPTAYFPPISYFSLLAGGDVFLEAHENYQKQSWRNRCNIMTSNGVESLMVPVVHQAGHCADGSAEDKSPEALFRVPITEIRIDWSRDWLTRQRRALDSAYMSSAFFSHYREGLYSLLDARPERLWDLNLSLILWMCGIWALPLPGVTESFGRPGGLVTGPGGQTGIKPSQDVILRPDIHPKHPDRFYVPRPYWQVFGARFPFAGNLSALDLLFNEGPDGRALL